MPRKMKIQGTSSKSPYSCHRETPGLTKPWRQQWATSPWHPVILAGIRLTASLPPNLGTVSVAGNLRKSPGRMIPNQGLESPHLHVIESAPILRSQVQLDKVKIILHHAYSSFWTHYGHNYRHTYILTETRVHLERCFRFFKMCEGGHKVTMRCRGVILSYSGHCRSILLKDHEDTQLVLNGISLQILHHQIVTS